MFYESVWIPQTRTGERNRALPLGLVERRIRLWVGGSVDIVFSRKNEIDKMKHRQSEAEWRVR